MFKNYLHTAFRSIRRNVSYTFLNVLGLTLGVASCLVIFLVVRNELGFDNFNSKSNRTYRVTLNGIDFNANVSVGIVPAMRNDFPELEQVSQVFYQNSVLVKIGGQKYMEKNVAFADEAFLNIFDYQWLQGNYRTALVEPKTIVLTESIAKKYFGNQDAMGQLVTIGYTDKYKVTGVIKDVPPNTHIPFGFLMSYESIKKDVLDNMSAFWAIPGGSYAYILLPQNYQVAKIQSSMPGFIKKNWGKDVGADVKMPLQPLRDIHFDQRYINNITTPTSRETYWALAGVAILIIITASINFVNLATTQAIKRGKEVGVRKVLGANRGQLVQQFLGETAMLVVLSVVLAFIAAYLLLPLAAKWLDIKIDNSQLLQPSVLLLVAGLTVSLILLAGLYPAFVQSAFRPVETLKSKSGVSFKGLALRKSLVVVQFAITQVLIIGTLIVAGQMDFFENRDLGFNKDAVITFNMPDMAKNEALKQQLSTMAGVKQVSFSSAAPAYNTNFMPFSDPARGYTKDDVTEGKAIDENYTDMFGLTMLAGQKINKTIGKDSIARVVVNETLIQKLGWQNPQQAIGQLFECGYGKSQIIGVVKDFQSESKHKKRRPCILIYNPRQFFMVSVKLQPAGMHQTISKIDKEWSAMFPQNLFQYQFLDEHIAQAYTQEEKEYAAFKIFSIIAILIGCLGLYGLVAFAAVHRIKEVGIRKVLGASLMNIVYLFSKEFILLIAIAFVVAAPLAYFIMNSWLQNFAYQISIGAGIFIVAIITSLTIAALTIAYQAVKAGVANPVRALKQE